MTLQLNKSFLEEVNDPLFSEKGIRLFVKRDDQIHPYVSGNKWRKLKYNIEAFLQSGKEYLLTMGGAYSNHIVATATAGKEFGIMTVGIIRGDELEKTSNPALHFAKECGMELIFVSREKYKALHDLKGLESFIVNLSERVRSPSDEPQTLNLKQAYVLPEGGFNELAVKGCEEIVNEINIPFDYICCASGTGATLSGIVRKLNEDQQAIGFSVLHGETFLENQVSEYVGTKHNWSINFNYHFGGYARTTEELKEFCKQFSKRTNILIEPIYTGKMFFGIYDLLKKDFFKPGSIIVAVHTGGTKFVEV